MTWLIQRLRVPASERQMGVTLAMCAVAMSLMLWAILGNSLGVRNHFQSGGTHSLVERRSHRRLNRFCLARRQSGGSDARHFAAPSTSSEWSET